MKLLSFFLFIWVIYANSASILAQETHYIWDNVMPNSKGVTVKDSIANERQYQVARPSISVFLPAKWVNKNAAVLIVPSGGFSLLTYQGGGEHLARWFNTFGITAFVLRHRLPKSPDLIEPQKAPLQDAQRAMKYIRKNAAEWDIDVNRIGVMGCSAGGYVAASLSTNLEDWSLVGDDKDEIPFIPNFTILISPVITMDTYTHKGSRMNLLGSNVSQELINKFSCENNVTGQTPPAFIVHAADDDVVLPINSILYYSALMKKDIKKSSLFIFPSGGHQVSLRNDSEMTNFWPYLAERWLIETGFIE